MGSNTSLSSPRSSFKYCYSMAAKTSSTRRHRFAQDKLATNELKSPLEEPLLRIRLSVSANWSLEGFAGHELLTLAK